MRVCPQSAALEGNGDQLAEFWEWVSILLHSPEGRTGHLFWRSVVYNGSATSVY